MKKLVIIGASGHGKVVADIAKKLNNYTAIVFLDDRSIQTCLGYPVVGKASDFQKYLTEAEFFVAIGNNAIRREMMERLLANGATLPTLIHPSAVIGADVEIGVGSLVVAGAVINPCVKIGKGVIVNTCSSIDHDCVIEDYAHISVGARLAGTVKVESTVWVGLGAMVKNNVSICADCVIGAGAVVVKNIQEPGTYIGVPARRKN